MRRLKSANPHTTHKSPVDSLNNTLLPIRSSLFDFETVASDLVALLQEANQTKKTVLQEKEREKEGWKARCRKLRGKHSDLLQENTALRNKLAVKLHSAGHENGGIEEDIAVITECVSDMQLSKLKYMNQELQTQIEEIRDAVQADEHLYVR